MQKQPEIIRAVKAGQKNIFEHSVILACDIPDGTKIIVKNGGVVIEGNVKDRVKITVKAKQSSSSSKFSNIFSGKSVISSGNGTIISGGNSTITINGQVITGNTTSSTQELSGIEVKGKIGSDAELISDNNIKINNAGQNLEAKAKNNFTAERFLSGSVITAGNKIKINSSIGSQNILNAGNNCSIDRVISLGNYIKAGNNVEIRHLGIENTVSAGNNVKIGSTQEDSKISAGNNIIIDTADASVKTNAGNKVKIGTISAIHRIKEAPKPAPKLDELQDEIARLKQELAEAQTPKKPAKTNVTKLNIDRFKK